MRTRADADTRAFCRGHGIAYEGFSLLTAAPALPAGSGQLGEGDTIPKDRTSSAYDIVGVFSDLTTTTVLDRQQGGSHEERERNGSHGGLSFAVTSWRAPPRLPSCAGGVCSDRCRCQES